MKLLPYSDITKHLCNLILGLPKKPRQIIAVAGPPASGKSTAARALAHAIGRAGKSAAVIPMDGFHLDNAVLEARGILPRKGAPHSFDLQGFTQLLARIAENSEAEIAYPLFDRARDISIAGAATLPRSVEFVIVEGNYLLLDQDGWRDLRKFWNSAIMLMPPRAEIEARLLQRWIDHGHTPEAARARRDANDLPNAELVLANALPADWVMAEAA